MATYEFSLQVTVDDENALYQAALEQARKEGAEYNDLMDPGTNEINVEACLQVLLDPSTLIGCSIEESHAEMVCP